MDIHPPSLVQYLALKLNFIGFEETETQTFIFLLPSNYQLLTLVIVLVQDLLTFGHRKYKIYYIFLNL